MFEKLTEREQNVLKFVARGYSAPETRREAVHQSKTVDTYKQRINEKLGLAHPQRLRRLRAQDRISLRLDPLIAAICTGPPQRTTGQCGRRLASIHNRPLRSLTRS